MAKKNLEDLTVGDLPETVVAVKKAAAPARYSMPTLTDDEMKALEAQAHEEVESELKEKIKADFLAKTKADMKRKALFVEGGSDAGNKLEPILIDLPKFSDRITLDGVIYMHGNVYNFTTKKAATIKEVIFRQWMHHAEINGLDMNEFFGRRKYSAVINPKSVGAQ